MIDKSEIMDFSREFGLVANVIEKDYVLGWILAGISNHTEVWPSWVFKGGTCLKKCYFETYRFSEDLDFTLTESSHLNQEFLVKCFEEISEWVYDATGIEIPKDLIRFDVYENNRGGMSAQGRIGYRGPMQPGGDLPRLKLDLTLDEILVLDPAIRDVHHPYSDCPDDGIQSKCYCFEEVFAEKIRATKIALGHHQDDIVETFFLNMFFNGQLKTMPPKLLSDNKKHVVIRPLALCKEHDIAAYATIKNYPLIPCNLCGSQENMQRKKVKAMIMAKIGG